VYMYVIMLGQV